MTSFHFRLQRVLDYRRSQFQLAESEHGRAQKRLHEAQAQIASLATAKSETRDSVARLPLVAGRILEPLTYWFHWTETEAHRLLSVEKALAVDLAKRRDEMIEAQRKVRLLEKLRDHRHSSWQGAVEREIEQIAAESINSRYARELRELRRAAPSPHCPSHP